MADNVPLGMEFMRWQNVPSITETIMGGKSPLLKTIGLMMAGGGEGGAPEGAAPPPAMGQGVSVGGGVGMAPNKPAGLGIAPGQFNIPSLTFLQLGQPAQQQGVDTDGDGQVDSFWGIKK